MRRSTLLSSVCRTGRTGPAKAVPAHFEGRMKTVQTEYKTDIARLETKIAEAKVTIIVVMLGIVGLAAAILKFA